MHRQCRQLREDGWCKKKTNEVPNNSLPRMGAANILCHPFPKYFPYVIGEVTLFL